MESFDPVDRHTSFSVLGYAFLRCLSGIRSRRRFLRRARILDAQRYTIAGLFEYVMAKMEIG